MTTSLLDQLTTLLAYLNVPAKLDQVLNNQNTILANQEKTMAAIDDFKAQLAQLSTDVAAEIAALQAAQSSNNDAAIAEATANLKALSVQLEASVAPPTPPAP